MMITPLASALAILFAQQLVTEAVPRADYLVVMDGEFAAMDLNQDGTVSAEEIAQRQNASARQQIVQANRQIFANLDSDGNGMLTPEEFLQLAASPQPVDPAPQMERLDLNRDGTISLVEHRTVMLATFDALDTDKDGIVTPAEGAAIQQAPQTRSPRSQAPQSQGR